MVPSATKHPQVTRGNLYSDGVSPSNCGFGMNQFEDPWGGVKRDSFKILTIPQAYYRKLSDRVRCTVTPLFSDQICHIMPGRITGWRHCRHIQERAGMCSDKPLTFKHQLSPMHYLHLWSIRLSPITIRRHSEPSGILGK